jgi:glycosyltransferase involved in cell wall biosynthesis
VLTGAGHEGKPLPEGVEASGHVSAAELVRLYRTATALVYPSLYEGFGMPVLEAMACGCPVACSNVASLPEVGGDAVRYFDPTSVDELTEAILATVTRPDELVGAAIERASGFTWEACARRHDDVYRELIASA